MNKAFLLPRNQKCIRSYYTFYYRTKRVNLYKHGYFKNLFTIIYYYGII